MVLTLLAGCRSGVLSWWFFLSRPLIFTCLVISSLLRVSCKTADLDLSPLPVHSQGNKWSVYLFPSLWQAVVSCPSLCNFPSPFLLPYPLFSALLSIPSFTFSPPIWRLHSPCRVQSTKTPSLSSGSISPRWLGVCYCNLLHRLAGPTISGYSPYSRFYNKACSCQRFWCAYSACIPSAGTVADCKNPNIYITHTGKRKKKKQKNRMMVKGLESMPIVQMWYQERST